MLTVSRRGLLFGVAALAAAAALPEQQDVRRVYSFLRQNPLARSFLEIYDAVGKRLVRVELFDNGVDLVSHATPIESNGIAAAAYLHEKGKRVPAELRLNTAVMPMGAEFVVTDLKRRDLVASPAVIVPGGRGI